MIRPLIWTVEGYQSRLDDQIGACKVLEMLGPRAAMLRRASSRWPSRARCGVPVSATRTRGRSPTLRRAPWGTSARRPMSTTVPLASYIATHIESQLFPREHVDALFAIAPNSPEVGKILMEMAAGPAQRRGPVRLAGPQLPAGARRDPTSREPVAAVRALLPTTSKSDPRANAAMQEMGIR